MTSNPVACTADGGTSDSSCGSHTDENTPCSVVNAITTRRPFRRTTRLFEGVEELLQTEQKTLDKLQQAREELENETRRKREELESLAAKVEERMARVSRAASLAELTNLRARKVSQLIN